jgi:hypothetical protein
MCVQSEPPGARGASFRNAFGDNFDKLKAHVSPFTWFACLLRAEYPS